MITENKRTTLLEVLGTECGECGNILQNHDPKIVNNWCTTCALIFNHESVLPDGTPNYL